jgi:hypothetical protein
MERMAVEGSNHHMVKLATLAAAGALLLGGMAASCESRGDAGDGNDLQRAYGTDGAARPDPVVQRMSPDVFDLNTLGLVEQTHS